MDILSVVKSAIMGIVEGITEFLPISSTGHLIIVERFLKLSSDQNFVSGFEVVIQLGAILAIVVLYWKRLWPWATPAAERIRTWKLWLRVIVGIIPAFILGYLLDSFITRHLFTPPVVAIALMFYGVVLIFVEYAFKRRFARMAATTAPAGGTVGSTVGGTGSRSTLSQAPGAAEAHGAAAASDATAGSATRPAPGSSHAAPKNAADLSALPLGTAFLIGIFQTLALIPGTSRSAATIIGGMIVGLGRAAAAEFSFFLAVPVMVGASGLTLYKQGLHFSGGEWGLLAIGFVVAFVCALFVVRAFMRFLQRHDFVPFGIYRIALGLLVIVLLVAIAPA